MTTKEKAGYDFDMMLERKIVFLQLNFKHQNNVVFEHDSFWKEAARFPLPGTAELAASTGMSRWDIYEQPIVSVWKVKGRGIPMPYVSIY